MNIPENGRVVVIDDKIREGLPLVVSLAKQNIPVIYFSGKKEELPVKPLIGIRIVFLDIVLGTDGQRPRIQVETASRIFKSIIDVNNGPYLLIAWTKHDEHIENIKNELSDRPPCCFLDLQKSKCKDKDGNFSLSKIEKKIKSELKKTQSFHLFTLWENLLHSAAGETVNDFSSFYKMDEVWDKNMSSVFFQLAKAYAGERIDVMKGSRKKKEIVKNALLAYNGALIDTLENKVKNTSMTLNGGDTDNIPPAIRAKINKKLLLFFDKNIKSPEPGNVYEVTAKLGVRFNLNELFEGNKLNEYQQKEDLISRIIYIFLEVSPSCDCAQNNWRVHRCVSGVMWPHEYENKIKKKSEFIYISPLFDIDGRLYKLVFNLRYLITLPMSKLRNKKASFRIRHDLLIEIQSHIARHINRPGIISVG